MIVLKYFPTKHDNETVKAISLTLQTSLEKLRVDLFHPLFYSLLISKKTRERTLKFFTEALVRNKNRAQLQSDERVLAGDGFFINLTNILQLLSVNIKRDKIDPYYPFHPQNQLMVKKDDSRIKFNSNDADKWLTELSSKPGFQWEDVSFSTECFFQTMYALHLSVIPCQRKYVRRLRVIRELGRIIETFAQSDQQTSTAQGRIRRCKEQMLKYHKAKLCAEAGLLDERFLGRCVAFYNQFINFLFKVLNCDTHLSVELPLSEEVPPLFASFPDWYIEDIAEFYLFVIQYYHNVLEQPTNPAFDSLNMGNLIVFIITIICSPNYINNPYLTAKFIEIVYMSSPLVNSQQNRILAAFHNKIVSHPLAESQLVRSLMKFYTDIETTGSSSEFYDKFTIRYHISIIFKSFWKNSMQKLAIINESENTKSFVKFINMLMNDTTFLLDESMVSLKRIHEVKEDMNDQEKWNRQTREQQENRERQLAHDERQCRSYLTLAVETVDMLFYLTQTVQKPFLVSVSYFYFQS